MKEETSSSSDIVNSSSVVVETSSSSEVVEETSSSSDAIVEESSSSEEVSSSTEVEVEESASSEVVEEETSSSSEEVSSSSEVAEQPKVEQTATPKANVTYSTATFTEYSDNTVKYMNTETGKTFTAKIPQGAIKDNNGNYITKVTSSGKPYYYVGENPIDIGIQHNGTSFYVSPTNKGTLQNPAVGDRVYIGDVMYEYEKRFGKYMWYGTAYNPDESYVEPADIIEFQGKVPNAKWG